MHLPDETISGQAHTNFALFDISLCHLKPTKDSGGAAEVACSARD